MTSCAAMRWSAPALWCACAVLGAGACGEQAAPRDAGASADAAVLGPPAPPPEQVVRVLRGIAIWYGGRWHGRKTASGERFDRHAMTAAHRTLPLGTRVRVTNLVSGRQVILRINDRGPYGRDRRRVLDVSEAAASALGFLERGSTRVVIEVLAPREEDDSSQ
jgi:rare lipoprotein A